MKIFKDLFIKYNNLNESNFYLLYSNNTCISGVLEPMEATDGGHVDFATIKDDTIEGQYRYRDSGMDIQLQNGEWISWKKITDDIYEDNGQEIIRLTNYNLTEAFQIVNQNKIQKNIEAVQHGYSILDTGLEKENIFVANWFLGNTCSYSCSYCPSYLNDGSIPWTDLEILKNFIDTLFEKKKGQTIVIEFTGGEVTLYKDYGALCAYIKSKGGIISMITNGSRTMDWWRKNVQHFDIIAFSYHTEFADRAKYLELADFLKDKVDLNCNIMTPPGKLDFCLELGEDIHKLGIYTVNLMPLIEDLEGELLPDYKPGELEAIDAFNSIVSEGTIVNKTRVINLRSDLSKVYPDGRRQKISPPLLVSSKENTWWGWNCLSGVTQIAIDAKGNIYRGWCMVGGKIGNIGNPNLTLPDDPVLCNKELCHCHFDFYSKKEIV
ncbi:MAG: radical SAM protein [Sporocytophaga sp.]|uniref:radical SAM protein n=1 Tax=Sporocytophaga sp. TaxID=2231183 RepID=UPI001B028992|nr:radical SAM protein [Sporocytophaga sp.]MBO9702046.1 radical SAM protein [Sporocytophaga sp.]